jgi:hypothetical protein
LLADNLLNSAGKEESSLETEACSEPTANTICSNCGSFFAFFIAEFLGL